ncbi:MAG TPA: hypothetical protein VE981_05620 [Planctomycetota bacterium]|nr:hypothetical protein [Planctomycetota bacterium]
MPKSLAIALLALAACSSPAPTAEEIEPLFRSLEAGNPIEAMAATEKLVAVYDDARLPRLEKALDAAPVRTLQLLGELSTDGSAKLLVSRLSYLLESKDAETVRMASVAAGLRRLKPATGALLHHPEASAVVRALGRIWEQDLDSGPLPREEEIDRLTVLAVVHRQAMGANPTIEACEAMLSVMSADELASFLSRNARDKFHARRLVDEAARRPGFDADKGLRIHEALLSNPDVELVAGILESSPFPLGEPAVHALEQDERATSAGLKIGDLAAKRARR